MVQATLSHVGVPRPTQRGEGSADRRHRRPRHGRTEVEWQICENEAEWETAQRTWQAETAASEAHVADRLRQARLRRMVRLGAFAFLLVLMGGGSWAYQSAQDGLKVIDEELDAAVYADLWMEHLAVGGPPKSVTADAALLHLGSDTAVVQVVTQPEAGDESYRQTLVYRRDERGWQQSAPSLALWGSPRRLETNYFIFHYRADDADAVFAAATALDALYPQIYAAFSSGLPVGPKQVVEITPEQESGTIVARSVPEAPIVVASPGVYLAPGGVSDADLLTQAVVLVLLDNLAAPFLQRDAAWNPASSDDTWHYQWYPLVDAVQLWLLWDLDLPLAVWRDPVMAWLTGVLFSDTAPRPFEFQEDLCASHRLWVRSPYTYGIPILCELPASQQGHLLNWYIWRTGPLRLSQLAPVVIDPIHPLVGGAPDMASTALLMTVVDYAAATYGAERIPVLIAHTRSHNNWHVLIPDVFGVPADEFEAGWNAFLAAQYGLEKAPALPGKRAVRSPTLH